MYICIRIRGVTDDDGRGSARCCFDMRHPSRILAAPFSSPFEVPSQAPFKSLVRSSLLKSLKASSQNVSHGIPFWSS